MLVGVACGAEYSSLEGRASGTQDPLQRMRRALHEGCQANPLAQTSTMLLQLADLPGLCKTVVAAGYSSLLQMVMAAPAAVGTGYRKTAGLADYACHLQMMWRQPPPAARV